MRIASWLKLYAAALLVAASAASVRADTISLNFSENSANQGFAGGQLIGPLSTNSSTWNNTNGQPNLSAGSLSNLIDESGTATAASAAWSASNPWYNADGTGDDEHRMSVGYLDDGGQGVRVTISNIPYANYRVYGLLGSDQGGSTNYTTLDFTVNGVDVFGAATNAPAYNTIGQSLSQTGSFWSLADGVTRGNYWTIDTTGSTLTIAGFPRNGVERGSLSAVIIEATVPEPASLALLATGALAAGAGALVRRRKNAASRVS
jgi:hypothetical protein